MSAHTRPAAPPRHLQIVSEGMRSGTWRLAADEAGIELFVDGVVVCTIAPWTITESGTHVFWWAWQDEALIACETLLADTCRAAAAALGVSAPVTQAFFATLREVGDLDAAPSDNAPSDSLLERFADLLAVILDEPLATLPGGDPGGPDGPTELRLRHFRPELSAVAAQLLEEAGR